MVFYEYSVFHRIIWFRAGRMTQPETFSFLPTLWPTIGLNAVVVWTRRVLAGLGLGALGTLSLRIRTLVASRGFFSHEILPTGGEYELTNER